MTTTKKPASPGRKRTKSKEAEIPTIGADNQVSAEEIVVPEIQPTAEESVQPEIQSSVEEVVRPENQETIIPEIELQSETSKALVPVIAKLQRDSDEDEEVVERVEHLNRGVGWILISAGVIGMIVPGVLGTPFLIMGGLALWPGNRERVERWRQGHSPKVFHGAMKQINRFLDDLEKRYPRISKQ